MAQSKSYAKKTKVELRKEIATQIKIANKRITNNDNPSDAFNMQKQRVEELAGIGKSGRITQTKSKTSSTSKQELVQIARELDYFNQWDIESDIGVQEFDDKFNSAYEKFRTSFGDVDKETYRQFVETVGALGEDWVQANYASSDIAELYKTASAKGKSSSVLNALMSSVKDNTGLTRTQRIDDVYKRLGLDEM